MDTFVWDENFITGLVDVDDQHQTLIASFNALSDALQYSNATGDDQALGQAYEHMLCYTLYHFAEEEQLMRERGLDARHVKTHSALHRQFAEQVATMWSARSALQQPAQSFVGFLAYWLGMHILGIDQAMARQMQGLAQGLTAEQAYAREAQLHDQGTQALIGMVGRLYHVLTVQNAELARSNALLEQRVVERTCELAHANARLEAYASTDALLKIANRGCFDVRIVDACASAQRRGQPLGLLIIDVDHFKRYNDSYGHPAGDGCLQAVARAVAQALPRSTDLLARYGGEEFVVILYDTDAAGAAVVAARVVAQVAALALPHRGSDVAPHVTVSVGASAHQQVDKDAAVQLLAQADAALYQAKATGRNRWVAG
jgi:hemerythrin